MTDDRDDTPEQDEAERNSRQTGGDAAAAGSIADREAVAADEDDMFEDEDED